MTDGERQDDLNIPDDLQLSKQGQLKVELADSLAEAFDDSGLARLVLVAFNQDLGVIVPPGARGNVTLQLVNKTESCSQTGVLLRAALNLSPNKRLHAFARLVSTPSNVELSTNSEGNVTTLTKEHRRALFAALIAAFPDVAALREMVKLELSENLNGISGKSNIREATLDLITWAEARDQVGDLIQAALASNSDYSPLLSVAKALGLAAGGANMENPKLDPPRRFDEIKRQTLERRRQHLLADYTAVNVQIDNSIEASNRSRLQRQAAELEREIQEIEDKLAGLE